MPALGRACMERHEAVTLHTEHEDCRGTAPVPCDEACARIADPEHENDSDACACSVEPLGAKRTGQQKSAKSRVPSETARFTEHTGLRRFLLPCALRAQWLD